MINIFRILIVISLINCFQIQISKNCSCWSVFTELDCKRNLQCEWNKVKKLCITQQTSNNPPLPIIQTKNYCDQFIIAADCTKTNVCIWNDSKCTFFASCTAYQFDSNEKCQSLSNKCISNGIYCIEKNTCSSYKTQKACIINSNNGYCYWDNSDQNNPKCENADDCFKLPQVLNTDAQCRDQISKCTANQLGGCIESGKKCIDQLSQVGCYQNKDQTQSCFWKEGKCFDKTCDNAITSLSTDKQCKDFLQTCTTKQGGGCIDRTSCGAAIKAACIVDNLGAQCFWNGNSCVDKVCKNALSTNTTNSSCAEFLPQCITTGAGCIENTGCQAAIIPDACYQTKKGEACHWDGQACKLKTCNNAGPNFVGHDQCTSYMNTCTANGEYGCTDRTCSNAPNSVNTNELCNEYFPKNNCITKNGGGCRVNTICEEIDIEIACISNIEGKSCFWGEGSCKTKLCSNSPVENNTHDLCHTFLSTCTVDDEGKCVEWKCENIVDQNRCTFDSNSNPCNYSSICYKKQCMMASISFQSHNECFPYLNTCTLDNSGHGCMDIPQNCQDLTTVNACFITKDGSKCGWNGTQCIDRVCSTAPIDWTYTTTALCDTYLKGCVVNNNLNGCIDLPESCDSRKNSQNCAVEQNQNKPPKCEWDQFTNVASPACIEIKCENAHKVSLKNKVTLNECWNYFSLQCIITLIEGQSTCIPRPNNCNGLIKDSCNKLQVLVGDKNCYWDKPSLTCKNVSCSSITFEGGTQINHDACYALIDNCTVDANPGTGCIPLKSDCSQYTFPDQCKKDSNGLDCIIYNGVCSYKSCNQSQDSHSFDSLTKCQSILKSCVQIQNKCTIKKRNCSEYENQDACEMNTLDQKQQCAWTDQTCSIKAFDCTLITGVGLNAAYCQYFNSSCSINLDGTACIIAQTTCANYTGTYAKNNCKWAIADGNCAWTGNSCVVVTSSLSCTSIAGTSPALCSQYKSSCTWISGENCQFDCSSITGNLYVNSCKAVNSQCTVKKDGSACVLMKPTCGETDIQNCTNSSSDGLCYQQIGGTCQSASNYLKVCSQYQGGNIQYNFCYTISNGLCSVNNAQTSCVGIQQWCNNYTTENDCGYGKQEGWCFWNSSQKCILKPSSFKCTDYSGSSPDECQKKNSTCTWFSGQGCSPNCQGVLGPFDFDSCQAFNKDCTVKSNAQSCITIEATCSQTSQLNCTLSLEGYCYLSAGNCISQVKNNLASSNCNTIQGTNLTASYCKGISQNSCSVNANQTSCIASQNLCSGYTNLDECFSSVSEKQCVKSGLSCISFNNSIDPCSKIVLNVSQYTNYLCNNYKTTCKAKKDLTGCEDKPYDCSSLKGVNLTRYQCMERNVTCTVNFAKDACITVMETCSEYSVSDCGYSLLEGECIIQDNKCIQNDCLNAPILAVTMNGCQSYSSNCILRIGGCQSNKPCSINKLQINCIDECMWNPTSGQCVDKTCEAAEASPSFDTHEECQNVGNCTVKINQNKSVGQGCIPLAACNTYQNSEQCKISDKAIICYWVQIDPLNQFCSEKSCYTAEITTNTHLECMEYMTGCTVNIINHKVQGCMPFKKCDEYSEEQCYLSSEKDQNNINIECGWNGNICANKSCTTANSTFNTPSLCSQYQIGCTVNKTDNGCILIPNICEGMTKNQCFIGSVDFNNRQCYWQDDVKQCVTKTCELSPNTENEKQCSNFLQVCTTNKNKCTTKKCEDFQFSTYDLCNAALLNEQCTTNGINCITIGACQDIEFSNGCVKDRNEQQCEWINNQCIKKACDTAPISIITEQGCQEYFTPNFGSCTTKKYGGCILKSSCTQASIQAACTVDNLGVACVWDNDEQTCRYSNCKDLNGLSHDACKKQNSQCTIGLKGKCATITDCEATKIQEACIEGKNGSCLWISKYINQDGTQGACFKYESCNSFSWKTDQECKLISPNCTTDGNQCVGITSCAESNTNGGCKTGIEGQCIQTVSIKGANDKVCKVFVSCDQAYYLTHQECQEANSNCTSDQVNGCIPLNSCSSYNKEGSCVINKFGVITDDNQKITSTGYCQWESNTNSCRDQYCQDFLLTTEQDCASKLKLCTSDGIRCILKGLCNSYYTENGCIIGGGTDGECFWDVDSQICKIKTCNQIQNGNNQTACNQVLDCVSDGTNCVMKGNCSSYKTQISCMSKGTDGLCVWTEKVSSIEGNCTLMNGCSSANDEVSCNQANNVCYWNQTSKICIEHTCETYQILFKECKYYFTWDMKNYNICSLRQGKCIATDVSLLGEEDCYNLSGYQYSWNSNQLKCSQCGSSKIIINENDSQKNLSNETSTTSSEYLLIIAFSGLSYLII